MVFLCGFPVPFKEVIYGSEKTASVSREEAQGAWFPLENAHQKIHSFKQQVVFFFK